MQELHHRHDHKTNRTAQQNTPNKYTNARSLNIQQQKTQPTKPRYQDGWMMMMTMMMMIIIILLFTTKQEAKY